MVTDSNEKEAVLETKPISEKAKDQDRVSNDAQRRSKLSNQLLPEVINAQASAGVRVVGISVCDDQRTRHVHYSHLGICVMHV
jgi:hypothetical protein